MRRLLPQVVLLLLLFTSPIVAQVGATKQPLKVLYLATDDESREKSFTQFLEANFSKVTVLKRDEFKPSQVGDADVVLLDWSQREDREDGYPSPLGDLETWTTPTVMLNSAGLLIAGPWQVIGGSG